MTIVLQLPFFLNINFDEYMFCFIEYEIDEKTSFL